MVFQAITAGIREVIKGTEIVVLIASAILAKIGIDWIGAQIESLLTARGTAAADATLYSRIGTVSLFTLASLGLLSYSGKRQIGPSWSYVGGGILVAEGIQVLGYLSEWFRKK